MIYSFNFYLKLLPLVGAASNFSCPFWDGAHFSHCPLTMQKTGTHFLQWKCDPSGVAMRTYFPDLTCHIPAVAFLMMQFILSGPFLPWVQPPPLLGELTPCLQFCLPANNLPPSTQSSTRSGLGLRVPASDRMGLLLWALWFLTTLYESELWALTGVTQWIECEPANQRITSSNPSQGTCLGCRPGPQQGACKRQPHIDVSLPLSFPSPLSKTK